MAVATYISIPGLADFRRDLKAIGDDLPKELRATLKVGAELVAEASRSLTPRRTGRLAASTRAGTSGANFVVRNPQPYANLIHWGGTTGPGHQLGPGHGSVRVTKSLFALRALDDKADAVAEKVGDGIVKLAGRYGW